MAVFKAVTLDVEPACAIADIVNAAEVQHTLHKWLILGSYAILVRRTHLVDMQLLGYAMTRVICPVKRNDIAAREVGELAIVGRSQPVLARVVPHLEVGNGLVDLAKVNAGLGTGEEHLLVGEFHAHDVWVTDTGNTVGVFKHFKDIARKCAVILLTVDIELAEPAWVETTSRRPRWACTHVGSVTAIAIECITRRATDVAQEYRLRWENQQVVLPFYADPVLHSLCRTGERLRPPVGELRKCRCAWATQSCVGILLGFLIIALEEVETCSKSICSSRIEVILRLFVRSIFDKGQTLDQVGFDFVVNIGKVATVVDHRQGAFRLGGIRHTLERFAQLGATVGHTEEVGKQEVVVGPDEQSLTLDGRHFVATTFGLKLGNALKHVVGTSDCVVAAFPQHCRRVLLIVALGRFPCKNFIVDAAILGKVVTLTQRVRRIVINNVVA